MHESLYDVEERTFRRTAFGTYMMPNVALTRFCVRVIDQKEYNIK